MEDHVENALFGIESGCFELRSFERFLTKMMLDHSTRPFLLLLSLVLVASGCGVKPPISIGKRDSLAGQGIVLILTNTSDRHLHDVEVEIVTAQGEAKEFWLATLEPHQSISVGWMKLDGWPIPPGATVRVACKGFPLAAGPFTT